MPLSGAERTQRYRERLKLNRPEEFERQRTQNLAKVKTSKKKISELTPEEAEERRQRWKREKRNSRRKQKAKAQSVSQETNSKEENLKPNDENFIRRLRKRNKVLVNKCRNYKKNMEKLKIRKETYRKRYQRLKLKKDNEIKDLNSQMLKLKVREEILENTLKTTYQSCSNTKEKQTLKKLALNSGNKTMISKMLGLKHKVKQKKKKPRQYHDIPKIIKFYTRDDVSRNTAGKKEVRTKNKEKVQIRYLLDTLVNTFRKYKSENGRYGFTTFYKNKPFFVLSPGLSSRSTCLCIKHSNFGFIHAAMVKHGLITGSIQDILSQVSCNTNTYECMWTKCDKCKDKKVQYNQINEEKSKQQVEWSRWERQDHTYKKKDGDAMKEITTKKMAKVIKKGSLNDLKNVFERDLILFKKHHFNMKHQQAQYQKAVLELKDNEVLIVCDFSENYQAKLAEEVQSMHYGASNLQICLHTGMVFWKNRTQSFCTLSDNTSHQPAAIWAHLIPILDMIKRDSPETTVVHFYTDGPSAQYRQKNNFYLLVHYTKKYQLQYATWSFYEAGHGKNVADGIGGSIKRTLDRKVCTGNDVIDAKDAYELLQQCLKVTKTFLIDSAEMEKVSKNLPGKIPVLKGTMQLHQITTILDSESNIIQYRDIGCFCGSLRGLCSCFSPKAHAVISDTAVKKLPLTRPTFSNKPTETSKENQIPKEIIAQATHEFQLSLEFPGPLNNTNETFDLDAIDESDLIFGAGNFACHSQDSLIINNKNNQGSTVSDTDKCLLGSAGGKTVDINTNLSEPFHVVDAYIEYINIPEEKQSSGQKLMQCDDRPRSYYVDPKKEVIKIPQKKTEPLKLISANKELPKKGPVYVDLKKEVIEIPQNKTESIKPLVPTKHLPKKNSIIIHDDIVIHSTASSSSANNKLPEKRSAVKYEAKKICKKPKTNKIICHKCISSIFGQKAKCILCKNWICSECIRGPISSKYICEICLND